MTPDRVLEHARKWIGTVEKPKGSNKVAGITDWYGIQGPWCAMFVSRVFYDAGLPLPASTSKGFAYTPSGAAWFRNQGWWLTRNPQPGDVVFFDFPGDGVNRISHVGIVEFVTPDGAVNTIEGNTDERGGRTGGKVMRRSRRVGIVGYGRPAYTVAPPGPKPSPQPQDRSEDLLMAVSLNDDDARRAQVRWWFHQFLGRGPSSVEEMNLHVLVLASDGADRCLTAIVDSEEGQAFAKGRKAAFVK